MTWPHIFLFCFAFGALWSFAGLLLGGLHLGHFAHGHGHHLHAGGKVVKFSGGDGHGHLQSHLLSMVNPSGLAVFLAWFGGVGYLLMQHSGWAFWLDLVVAIAVGLVGAWMLGLFFHFLQSRETVLDPMEDDPVGILGQVTCPIRAGGVGELIYLHRGARKALPARSDEGEVIDRGCEVIVTRYEKGIAFVRTWEAMTQDTRQHCGADHRKEKRVTCRTKSCSTRPWQS
jgi:membrane protein implicated in regulation of membrane protease activity